MADFDPFEDIQMERVDDWESTVGDTIGAVGGTLAKQMLKVEQHLQRMSSKRKFEQLKYGNIREAYSAFRKLVLDQGYDYSDVPTENNSELNILKGLALVTLYTLSTKGKSFESPQKQALGNFLRYLLLQQTLEIKVFQALIS